MSGLFLLASKLRAVLNCHPVWNDVRKEFLELADKRPETSEDDSDIKIQ